VTRLSLPAQVTIVEVGPRDGLQNEAKPIPTETKIALIEKLTTAGIRRIEATSFVSPKWVPQLADAKEVLKALSLDGDINYSVLTPNMKGFEFALESGVREVAVFAAASETFSQKNTNCSIADSIKRFEPILKSAQEKNIRVRAYVSCVLGCPYEGEISPETVLAVSKQLLDLGCYEVSLGDTIGIGTAHSTMQLLDALLAELNTKQLAVHFHNTYGQALANILIALQYGINTIDSSVAGLGGCPYAKGASGNVATEDVLYMLEGFNIATGISMTKLLEASQFITEAIARPNRSAVANAMSGREK
jgi:hydroxymethylglutaryl-CoA lyase